MPSPKATALIAYDGSDEAAAAIRQAGALIGPRPAVVVNVWESLASYLLHTDVDGLTGGMREAAAELDEEDRHAAERLASEGAELASDAGFDATARAVRGRPKAWPTLLAEAEASDAAVIVIGSRGLGCVKSALVGSVSSSLLHHAHRPVLVVPPCEDRTHSGPALIAFDGSEAAHAAVGAAGELLARREVSVETVWSPCRDVAAGGMIGVPVAVGSRAAEELDRTVAAQAQKTAHEGARLAAQAGLAAEAAALEANGPQWTTLRGSADRRDAPLIVVGSRGRGAVAEAVLGSTSSALVHHAHLPVLIAPQRPG